MSQGSKRAPGSGPANKLIVDGFAPPTINDQLPPLSTAHKSTACANTIKTYYIIKTGQSCQYR